MFYLRLFESLNRHGIRYLVVGGVAVNLHGVERMTKDVDIAVDASVDQSEAWEAFCRDFGAAPRQPVTWRQMYDEDQRQRFREEKGLIAFCILTNRPQDPVVDILFDPEIDFDLAYSRRRKIIVEEVEIPLISIPDLIVMKAHAARPRDLADIVHLAELLPHGSLH